jgi:hypothetical protein
VGGCGGTHHQCNYDQDSRIPCNIHDARCNPDRGPCYSVLTGCPGPG